MPTSASIRVVIVDDEPLARQILRELLAEHADIEVIAECANGFEAVKAVMEQQPDLLLLDVQMPKLDGFDVLELVGPSTGLGAGPSTGHGARSVGVIFVTAYDQYAIRAFEKNAIDYLLKPFGADRLAEALDRARARLQSHAATPVRELVSAAQSQRRPLSRLLIRDKADVHVVPVDKIDYIESQDDYVAIKVGGKSHLKEQTLSELEALLDPGRFVRIHRRYLLNVARLSKIEQSISESRSAILADGTELPISRTGYGRLRKLL